MIQAPNLRPPRPHSSRWSSDSARRQRDGDEAEDGDQAEQEDEDRQLDRVDLREDGHRVRPSLASSGTRASVQITLSGIHSIWYQ